MKPIPFHEPWLNGERLQGASQEPEVSLAGWQPAVRQVGNLRYACRPGCDRLPPGDVRGSRVVCRSLLEQGASQEPRCNHEAHEASSDHPAAVLLPVLRELRGLFRALPRALALAAGLVMAAIVAGCGKPAGDSAASNASPMQPPQLTVGVNFETLQTEYWVAGFEAIRSELAKRNIRLVESVADGDANRQLQQVRTLVTRKVDGIILVPKDAKTCLPAIKAANEAGIPIVLFNRPAAAAEGVRSVAVVADNRKLTRETVEFMVEQARKTGRRHKAMVLVGDLGDINAVGRRDGFYDAVKGKEDLVEIVAEVPTEWNQEKARAGVVNALQANPDISFIFASSDFLFPSVVAALKSAGKYHRIGEPGHVILGGFDGDATAYQMLVDGYLDATGVQDVYFEAEQAVAALWDQREGKQVAPLILDPGFVIHQGNLEALKGRMWGANVRR